MSTLGKELKAGQERRKKEKKRKEKKRKKERKRKRNARGGVEVDQDLGALFKFLELLPRFQPHELLKMGTIDVDFFQADRVCLVFQVIRRRQREKKSAEFSNSPRSKKR